MRLNLGDNISRLVLKQEEEYSESDWLLAGPKRLLPFFNPIYESAEEISMKMRPSNNMCYQPDFRADPEPSLFQPESLMVL